MGPPDLAPPPHTYTYTRMKDRKTSILECKKKVQNSRWSVEVGEWGAAHLTPPPTDTRMKDRKTSTVECKKKVQNSPMLRMEKPENSLTPVK